MIHCRFNPISKIPGGEDPGNCKKGKDKLTGLFFIMVP